MNNILFGICIPLIGTTLGAACVFLMKNKMDEKIEKMLLGFAAGVMIAASVWSLLIPSMEMSEAYGKFKFVPAVVGFLLGILFLLVLDSVIPHLHFGSDKPEGVKAPLKKTTMLVLAVTLHNLPEGMAVGVTFASSMIESTQITLMGALALAIGIAIQNFPEGAIISMPLRNEGNSKKKSFLFGFMSGLVEPVSALITIMLIQFVVPVLPYLLSFAAGAMFYVVIEELIPQAQMGKHTNVSTIGAALGFVIMMLLDTVL